jgi:hypothetical protein
MTTVTIYHNEHPDHWFGYQAGHPVREVFRYEDPTGAEVSAVEVADAAFRLFNAPPELLERREAAIAARYRAAELRSLSKGDLVHVGDTWLACESVGWAEVEPPTVAGGTP